MPRPNSVPNVASGSAGTSAWANAAADATNAVVNDVYAAGVGSLLAIPWARITGVPTAFAPAAHAASHATGGTDPLTSAAIGGFDRVASGAVIGTRIYVGPLPPASPAEGDIWVKG